MNLNAATHAIRRHAASLLLLALACTQFVEFTHLDEHSELGAAESCATCVQLDKPFSVAGCPATALSTEFAAETLPVPRKQVIAQAPQSRPSARAPPLA